MTEAPIDPVDGFPIPVLGRASPTKIVYCPVCLRYGARLQTHRARRPGYHVYCAWCDASLFTRGQFSSTLIRRWQRLLMRQQFRDGIAADLDVVDLTIPPPPEDVVTDDMSDALAIEVFADRSPELPPKRH